MGYSTSIDPKITLRLKSGLPSRARTASISSPSVTPCHWTGLIVGPGEGAIAAGAADGVGEASASVPGADNRPARTTRITSRYMRYALCVLTKDVEETKRALRRRAGADLSS